MSGSFAFDMTSPPCRVVLPHPQGRLASSERGRFADAKKNCQTEFDLDTVKMLMKIFVSPPFFG